MQLILELISTGRLYDIDSMEKSGTNVLDRTWTEIKGTNIFLSSYRESPRKEDEIFRIIIVLFVFLAVYTLY